MSLSSYQSSHFAFQPSASGRLGELRTAALEAFGALGFPNRRVENWKYTSVKKLAAVAFEHDNRDWQDEARERVSEVSLGDEVIAELVFVNGRYVEAWSRTAALPEGVTVTTLQEALKQDVAGVMETLSAYAPTNDEAFTALNTAFLQDGLYLHVAKGVVFDAPIQITVLADPGQGPIVAHPRHLIRVDAMASATLIERHVGRPGQQVFTNSVSEIVVGDGAQFTHHLWSHGEDNEARIGRIEAHLGRDATYTHKGFWLSGGLARNDLNVVFEGTGGHAHLDGLYIVGDTQLVDNHVTADHAEPHCVSRMEYKGVLGGKAKGVYNGRVVVRKDAQRTDSVQSNRNLLLSSKADVNTKPELEIYADDVTCGHGTTVGQLDESQVHYLRTRGIPLLVARRLLTEAFAANMLESLDNEAFRAVIEPLVTAQLVRAHGEKP